MGMAHPLVARAVHWAGRCIEMYDAKPERQHQRLSVRFLKIGIVLIISIAYFIETKVMPPIWKLYVSFVHVIPFGDRQIDREHKSMSGIVTRSKNTLVGHNAGIGRLRAVETRMFDDPVFSNQSVE